MPSLGVNGATPYASGSNHPTAYNHSHRDMSGYDAKKQTRVKCTYCGCWARKGELCYQCKQPTGPLVLPRRNGYRVEPLVGGFGGMGASGNASSVFGRSYSSTSAAGGASPSGYFSARQAERLENVSGGRFSSSSAADGADGGGQSQQAAMSARGASPHNQQRSAPIVVGRTSSARPASSVYDDANGVISGAGGGGMRSHSSSTAAAGQTHHHSSSGSINGGVPARRYYIPAAPRHNGEVFVEQLKGHVISHRAEQLRQMRRAQHNEAQQQEQYEGEHHQQHSLLYGSAAGSGGGGRASFYSPTEHSHMMMHSMTSPHRSMVLNSSSGRSGGNGNGISNAAGGVPSTPYRSASSPRTASSATSTIRSSMKGVSGGYFYHDEQTAVGHKFREESAYDPSKQKKMKCTYCGCWAKKNAPCSLCKTVNRAY